MKRKIKNHFFFHRFGVKRFEWQAYTFTAYNHVSKRFESQVRAVLSVWGGVGGGTALSRFFCSGGDFISDLIPTKQRRASLRERGPSAKWVVWSRRICVEEPFSGGKTRFGPSGELGFRYRFPRSPLGVGKTGRPQQINPSVSWSNQSIIMPPPFCILRSSRLHWAYLFRSYPYLQVIVLAFRSSYL